MIRLRDRNASALGGLWAWRDVGQARLKDRLGGVAAERAMTERWVWSDWRCGEEGFVGAAGRGWRGGWVSRVASRADGGGEYPVSGGDAGAAAGVGAGVSKAGYLHYSDS